MSMPPSLLFIKHARLVTCAGPLTTAAPSKQSLTDELAIIDDGGILVVDGKVAWLGPMREAPTQVGTSHIIDAQGQLVTPGLVDPHTHLVFAGTRAGEFARKMQGEDYQQIAASGGGIMATVRATREASDETLLRLLEARLAAMWRHGVTAVECKSGYGLDAAHEQRLLQVMAQASGYGGQLMPTLLGAHVVPAEWQHDRAGYVRLVVDTMIPAAARAKLATAVDVYCDENAFSVAETRHILSAARAAGLATKAHVGQFRDIGGGALLAELGARSGDHLEAINDEDAAAMARAKVTGVLLPGAWRTLRQAPPDAARLAAHGLRLAVGTDANPGTSQVFDLTLAAALAVRDAGLQPLAALLAITARAADAIGLAAQGRLRRDQTAYLAMWPFDDVAHFAYQLGGLQPSLLVAGKCVEDNRHEPALW